jgi:hypothetical protein
MVAETETMEMETMEMETMETGDNRDCVEWKVNSRDVEQIVME